MKTHEQRSDNLDCDVKPALHSEIIPILINIILLLHYWITFAGILFSKLFHLYLKLRFVIVFKLILIENQDDIHFGNFTWSVYPSSAFEDGEVYCLVGWLVLEVGQHCA